MSFLLLQTEDPNTLKDALPDLSRTSHIFVPVNDCRTVTVAEGGTHWSLLLVSIVDGIAFHYDSLGTGNITEGMTLTRKFMALVNRELRFMHLEDTPQQDNGSDCGVFVCMAMRHLLVKRLLMVNATQQVTMSLKSTDLDASAGRKEMCRIIERFRRKTRGKSPYVSCLTKAITFPCRQLHSWTRFPPIHLLRRYCPTAVFARPFPASLRLPSLALTLEPITPSKVSPPLPNGSPREYAFQAFSVTRVSMTPFRSLFDIEDMGLYRRHC